MNRNVPRWLFACAALALACSAVAQPSEFSFGVIPHPFQTAADEAPLREAIAATDADNLAFVVANGVKSATEPCTDALYKGRRELLDSAKNGLIVSLAGSDWSECKNARGKSNALERLNRLRDLFFADEFSLGASRIPLVRQSTTAKFRSYAENARWEIGNVIFATVNLPANNNRYLAAAGRNSEFEDRLIANRDWLQRTFTYATRKKLAGIVLFSDGNPIAKPESSEFFNFSAKRDGFTETRQYIGALAAKFPGKVLVVHGSATDKAASADGINWRNNLGVVDAASGWTKLTVNPASPSLFMVEHEAADMHNFRQ